MNIFFKGGVGLETPDFSFSYMDSDSLGEELAEWYTYSEEPEFLWNLKAFKAATKDNTYCGTSERTGGTNQPRTSEWCSLNADQRRVTLMKLLDQIEMKNKQMRDRAARAILYIAQGFALNSKVECYVH